MASVAPTVPASGGSRSSEPAAWLQVDWRAHQHWVTVEGRRVNVIDIGAGPAVVLVHGLGASWQCWLENMPALAERHRVIALDLPGFGLSEMPREEISITGYGRCVDAVCAALGVERAAIVGNSMGGFIGAEVAIEFATRVERLVLVSAAAFFQEYRRSRPLVALAGVTELGAAWIAAQSEHIARRPRLRSLVLSGAGIRHPERIPGLLGYELVSSAQRQRAGFLPALRAIASYPIRNELPRIACPTLIVWGDRDRLVRVADADELERLIPDARKVVFADTGHVAMLEDPARFNALLEDFLAQ